MPDLKQHGISAAVAAMVAAGVMTAWPPKEKIVEKPVYVTVAASKHAWKDLTQAETIAIGEALSSLKDAKVFVMCNDATCDDLAHDLDDAMQIAGAVSSLDRSALPLDPGISVYTAPGDARGATVADAIGKATGGKIAPIARSSSTAQGMVMIAIGKRR